jgi:uncharacterized protein YlxW (UPF0749 family)
MGTPIGAAVARVAAALRRRRNRRGRWVTGAVCLVIGLMISVSSLNARGYDLRPGRNTELVEVIRDRSRYNADLTREVGELREQVDALTARAADAPDVSGQIEESGRATGLDRVTGPGVTVTLTDAPASVQAPGLDEDLLVVHQQDIQAVANVLWASGAEAMTIQGQRVISTTGIKCVGNSVVLHGTPYAPPYVISGIGDPDRMAAGLTASDHLRIYQQYVDRYGLGYSQKREESLLFQGYRGAVDLQYARPMR